MPTVQGLIEAKELPQLEKDTTNWDAVVESKTPKQSEIPKEDESIRSTEGTIGTVMIVLVLYIWWYRTKHKRLKFSNKTKIHISPVIKSILYGSLLWTFACLTFWWSIDDFPTTAERIIIAPPLFISAVYFAYLKLK